MKLPVTRIQARNFRSLERVDLRLGPLNVLIGPNGSGKTNVLNVLRFLATTVRFDLAAALQEWNGFNHIQRQSAKPAAVELVIEGLVTANPVRMHQTNTGCDWRGTVGRSHAGRSSPSSAGAAVVGASRSAATG